MSVSQSSTGAATPADAAVLGQQSLAQFARGYECFINGLIGATSQQMALTRSLMEASVEDFNTLVEARTPEALLHAEFEVFRRHRERAIGAAQKITNQLGRVWTEASEVAHSDAVQGGVVQGGSVQGHADPAPPAPGNGRAMPAAAQ